MITAVSAAALEHKDLSKEGVTMRRSVASILLNLSVGLSLTAYAEAQVSCNQGTLKGTIRFYWPRIH